MALLTEGMSSEEIIKYAETRPELVWAWGILLNGSEMSKVAEELGVRLLWSEPIRPGDLYLAKRNTGPHLLTCDRLGEACVHPRENAYSYDFNECVKVQERK